MEEYELLEGFKDDVRSLHPQVKIAQISLKIAHQIKAKLTAIQTGMKKGVKTETYLLWT